MNRYLISVAFSFAFVNAVQVLAQHDHAGSEAEQVKAPTIFLDKSPRVVEYQLKRLSNEQLLLVETQTDDTKYLPVFSAILTREGMSRAYRENALKAMVQINASDAVIELTSAIASIDSEDASAKRTVGILAAMLLAQPMEVLNGATEQLVGMASSGDALLAPVGYAALISSGKLKDAWSNAQSNHQSPLLLQSIELIPNADVRGSLHAQVLELISATDSATRLEAVRALAAIPSGQAETFSRVAELLDDEQLRVAAVKTLLSVPKEQRSSETGQRLIAWLVDFAEKTPAEKRTENAFLDAMELVDQLLAAAPSEYAKNYRNRLRETVVRVIRIHTVEEEMRYDIPFFAVEAGRPVQIVLINEDLMPHNLVITKTGALKEVAEEGLAVGPEGGMDGKQYVPNSDKVLYATNMIAANAQERLTFDAPVEPGEYPYVCTFPRHWMRMYGVMVVVEDLDAWLKDPVEPEDPIGSNRQFVQSWTVDDFQGLEAGLRGRSPAIGERLFVEATCAQCHKAGTVGVGNVGPELSESYARFKGDSRAVLQEILDPSHRIDDKYAVHLILDANDRTYSGLVVAENTEQVSLLENPEAKQPTVILKDDIEQMVKTSNSMMPKGLLDRFSKDEIFELLSFIQNIQK